jgi:hypothetical protein
VSKLHERGTQFPDSKKRDGPTVDGSTLDGLTANSCDAGEQATAGPSSALDHSKQSALDPSADQFGNNNGDHLS